MNKLLTESKITFSTPLASSRFAFARVSVAPEIYVQIFEREMIRRCPACGNASYQTDSLLPVNLCVYFSDSYVSTELALFHRRCFDGLRDVTPDITEKMRRYAAGFVARSEARFAAWFRARFPNAGFVCTGRR
jgi:hypothetical protein